MQENESNRNSKVSNRYIDKFQNQKILIHISFESRVRELSGNKGFIIQNLSPDIQIVIKRYLNAKVKDNWEDLGSCLENDRVRNKLEMKQTSKRSVFIQSTTPEPQNDFKYKQDLLKTLQSRRIMNFTNQNREKETRDFMSSNTQQFSAFVPNGYTTNIIIQKSLKQQNDKNLPSIISTSKVQSQSINNSIRKIPKYLTMTYQNQIQQFCRNTSDFSQNINQDVSSKNELGKLPCQLQPNNKKSILQWQSINIVKSQEPTFAQIVPNLKLELPKKKTQKPKQNESLSEELPQQLDQMERSSWDEVGLISTTKQLSQRKHISMIQKFSDSSQGKTIKNLEQQMNQDIPEKMKIKSRKVQSQTPLKEPQANLDKLLPIFKDKRFKRDPQFQEKYVSYREALNIINLTNNLFVQTPSPEKVQIYKCFVGKGNNGLLVKQILKTRWWWTFLEDKQDFESINLMWTSLKFNSFIDSLKAVENCDNLMQFKQQEQNHNIKTNDNKETISFYKKILGNQNQQIVELIKIGKTRWLKEQQIKSYNNTVTVYNSPEIMKIHNHIENNFHLSNKKALFYNMRSYYQQRNLNVFDYLPLTFHLRNSEDIEFLRFQDFYLKNSQNETNLWIVKPGENSNRGNGITVCQTLAEITEILDSKETHKGILRTYIVQQYLDRPLLYCKRKFDIRCFAVISSINGYQRGYWYQDGYIRTSSKEFTTKNVTNRMIHLTNDAVQKKGDGYGKFEKGNKLSFEDFQRYLESMGEKVDFFQKIYPCLRNLARDAVQAVYHKVNQNKRENTFEIFGLDFMIDQNYKVWLIEVNTNPCLEVSSPILSKIIPSMIENVFRIILDPVFPPPHFYTQKRMVIENILETNKLEVIFDENEYLKETGIYLEEPVFAQIQEESDESENDEQEDIL